MNITRNPVVDDYLAQVRAALADLPPGERDELLEDLAAHLDEVAAEEGEAVAARLGPAAEYAEELRRSAGYPPAAGGGRWTDRARTTAARKWTDWGTAILAVPGSRATAAFAVRLRPAWWVLRAYVLTFVVAALLNGQEAAVGAFPWPAVPTSGSSGHLLGLLLCAALVVGSVYVGLRAERRRLRRPARVVVGIANVAIVLGGLALLPSVANVAYGEDYGEAMVDTSPSPSAMGAPALTDNNGNLIQNLYAYTPEGKLIPAFQLFDQAGVPVVIEDGLDGDGVHERQRAITAAGVVVPNVYPYRWLVSPDHDITQPDEYPGVTSPPAVNVPGIVVPSPAAATPTPSPSAVGPTLETPTPTPTPSLSGAS